MILEEIILVGIGGVVAVCAALVSAHRRKKNNVICRSCEHLVKEGGYYRYQCDSSETFFSDQRFDIPPKYCRYYKPRKHIAPPLRRSTADDP